ncbi:ZIP zinc transporter-domain-containing protein [Chytriomyces sp. MP71]|nr:ZIP zinc transporter-domain-containing protein [Chytriomyces sp. MP71]
MGFGFLLALCAAMFSGAFIAGSIPLAFTFSEARLVLLSTFGSGLLVGTALTVILPEGVETLYSANIVSAAAPQPSSHTSQSSHSPDGAFKLPSSDKNHVPAPGEDAAHAIKVAEKPGGKELSGKGDKISGLDDSKGSSADDHALDHTHPTVEGQSNKNFHNSKGSMTGAKGEEEKVLLAAYEDAKGTGLNGADIAAGRPGLDQDDPSLKERAEKRVVVAPAVIEDSEPGDVDERDVADDMDDNDVTYDADEEDNLRRRNQPVPENSHGEYSHNHVESGKEHVEESSSHSHGHLHETHYEPSKYIGPSLLLGFLFMLLIDQIGSSAHGHDHSHSHSHTRKNSADKVLPHHQSHSHSHTHGGAAEEKDELVGHGGSASNNNTNVDASRSSGTGSFGSATLGLVVHAAADGIALGAALTSDQSSLGLIVFLAIMLHKAPSAFGLTTHLLRTLDSTRGGISTRARIRSHLFLFSIAAPVGAILTYGTLGQLGFEDVVAMRIYTGAALLFSAGTFLYVATVHVLPEIYAGSGDGKLSVKQTAALVIGMFLPYFMMVEHSH